MHPRTNPFKGHCKVFHTRCHILRRDARRELGRPAGLLRHLHLLLVHGDDGAGVGVAEHEVIDQLLPVFRLQFLGRGLLSLQLPLPDVAEPGLLC